MKVPLVLQDINNKILTRNIVVTSPTFFIKSFSRFGITIQENYELNFINGTVDIVNNDNKIFDIPYIYSVLSPDNIVKSKSVKPKDANFSYTLYLGKTEKIINLEIVNIFDEELYSEKFQLLSIHYKPNNVILESQEHYNSLLINNDLPSLDKLLPAIIKSENEYDLIRKLLLDFKEIKKHRGKLKSIEKFLNFIGFDPDSIKLYPEYTTPNNTKTLNPNKSIDFKNGYYHVLYDNWIVNDNDKYTHKNLPKRLIQVKNVEELFDKLYYALSLANDYFTIDEQQMSFFGMSNSVNSEQMLSITSNMTQTYYIDTLSLLKTFNINIYNRTTMDSFPLYIVKNKVQKLNVIKLSEVKIYVGNNIKQNNQIFLVDKEITDNYSDTDLTDEEEMNIEYLFGNVLNIQLYSKNNKVQYTVKNLSNELIQFKSDEYELTNNLLQQKLYIGNYGMYELKFYTWDYYGNREEYKYIININEANIDFDIYNSSVVSEDLINDVTQDIDSTIYINSENNDGFNNKNLELINSQSNILLQENLINYFDIVSNESHKNLLGFKQFSMKLMNKNISMKDVTETLPCKYIDNFLNIISLKYFEDTVYEFSDDLFVKLIDIKITDTITEKHWFITTQTNSVNISKNIYTIKLIHNGIKFNISDILNNDIPESLEYRTVIIPINYDFELYNELDETDITNLPLPSISPIKINSIYPRLKNIELDNINENDDTYSLKIGDIILCKIDEKYIINATDIKWSIYNAFTNEIYFETNDYSLKYRVMEKTLYSIKLTILINGEQYVINKNEIQTSFII